MNRRYPFVIHSLLAPAAGHPSFITPITIPLSRLASNTAPKPSFAPPSPYPFHTTIALLDPIEPKTILRMCQVTATRFPCTHTCKFRAISVCPSGFSCSNLSCRVGNNIIVKIIPSDAPLCHACLIKKEMEIRAVFERQVAIAGKEARSQGWGKRKLEGVVGNLRKVEESELKKLRKSCGRYLVSLTGGLAL